jgi:hypothetical protein
MFTLPRLTARLAAVASFAALLAAACSPDSTGPSNSALLANRQGGGGGGGTPASSFTVLAQAAVSCSGGSITGDVGTFQATPPGAITLVGCLVNGSTHIGDAAAVAAFNAFLAQYDALAPLPGDCDLAHTLLSTIPASITLSPGVYCTGAALTASTVTLTLDAGGNANATWLFKIGSPGPAGTGALTGTDFAVVLANGAQACNVTWWVSQAVTMTRGAFQGNILAGAAISMSAGTLNGNAWAGAKADASGVRVGDVTFTEGTTVVGCAGANGNGKDKDKDKCNQGVGNGPEGCDPGNSNHHNSSNDENGGTPGDPGRKS